MKLINLFDINSVYGNRSFKLMEGDLSNPGFPIDILALSAFNGGYNPVKGTVLGALYQNRNIFVQIPFPEGSFDFRTQLGSFYMPTEDSLIKSLLVLEILGKVRSFNEAMDNLYLALCLLESKGLNFRTIAMPVLGTGHQGIPLNDVMHDVISFSKKCLIRIPCIEQIILVSNTSEKTSALNEAMNHVLGRPSTTLPVTELSKNIQREICAKIDLIGVVPGDPLDDLKRVLSSSQPSALEIALVSRKLLEILVQEMLSSSRTYMDLAKGISSLKEDGIAPWTISYMHLLRVFSNEYAHSNYNSVRKPESIQEEDISVALFVLQRIVDFIHENK
jgi:hypothetical protein